MIERHLRCAKIEIIIMNLIWIIIPCYIDIMPVAVDAYDIPGMAGIRGHGESVHGGCVDSGSMQQFCERFGISLADAQSVYDCAVAGRGFVPDTVVVSDPFA